MRLQRRIGPVRSVLEAGGPRGGVHFEFDAEKRGKVVELTDKERAVIREAYERPLDKEPLKICVKDPSAMPRELSNIRAVDTGKGTITDGGGNEYDWNRMSAHRAEAFDAWLAGVKMGLDIGSARF